MTPIPCKQCGENLDVWRALGGAFLCYECKPCKCAECGGPVEEARYCYAVPTCYACLPPPPELEVLVIPEHLR